MDRELPEGRIPFRLRIGVTGHRDLADCDAAAKDVRRQLNEIAEPFLKTDTTELRVTLLSSLAEGADRLVVSEAISLFGEDRVDLHAILPMSPEKYTRSFHEPGSTEKFEQLLDKAKVTKQMPPSDTPEEAYEAAGRYVAEACDVLVALWDGRMSEKRGGTAATATYACREGIALAIVEVRRCSPSSEPQTWLEAERLEKAMRPAREAYSRVEQLNRESITAPKLRRALAAKDAKLAAEVEHSPIRWCYERVALWALPTLVRADALALRYQRLYYRLGETLFVLAALAVVFVAGQEELQLSDRYALLEVFAMAMAVFVYWWARRKRVQEQWIGYRSLAEGVRSGLFIAMTGARDRTPGGPESPAREEPWFQRAFSETWVMRPQLEPRRSEALALREFLTEAWIDDQVEYHRSKARQFEASHRRLTSAVIGLFVVTMIVGLVHALSDSKSLHRTFLFLAIVLPGFGAALAGIRDQRQHRIHEERSDRAAERLEALRRDLESQSSISSLQRLAQQIQSVIEAENVEWSGVVEFQELEIVI